LENNNITDNTGKIILIRMRSSASLLAVKNKTIFLVNIADSIYQSTFTIRSITIKSAFEKVNPLIPEILVFGKGTMFL